MPVIGAVGRGVKRRREGLSRPPGSEDSMCTFRNAVRSRFVSGGQGGQQGCHEPSGENPLDTGAHEPNPAVAYRTGSATVRSINLERPSAA
jgi:hypothetical protein